MGIKRALRLAVVSSLCLSVLSSPAHARDRVIAHDTSIASVYSLGGDLVYFRYGEPAWRRWVDGRLRSVTAIPEHAGASAIGRDAKGRTVLTFAVSGKWFLYDLARDRSRPLRGLPTGCPVERVSLWRRSMAYTLRCADERDSGVFVKQGDRTQKIEAASVFDPFVFRAGTLAAIVEDGLDNAYVEQYMANGRPCQQRVDSSFGDETAANSWYPSGLWLGGGSITWTMGFPWARPNFAILSASLPSGCGAPGPVGQLRFKSPVRSLDAVALDGRRLFYADGKALRLHELPARPSYRPPRNDGFEHAKVLPPPSLSVTGNVAHATVQPGEPLEDAKHTVWYAFRPKLSGPVDVSVLGACRESAFICNGAYRYGVYTGDRVDKLSRLRPSGSSTRVDAIAGQTYWIAVGAALPEPKYEPFTLTVTLAAPQAPARDQVIAHDTLIQRIYALGGDLVYRRAGKPGWGRWVNGQLGPVSAIPESADAGAIGRDAKGRMVFTFAVAGRWFVYDLAGDTATRVRGLPAACAVSWVGLWGRSMAYSARCKDEAMGGVFVRRGKRTRRIVADPYQDDLVFRGSSLAGILDTGTDDFVVEQYMAAGKPCRRFVDSSWGGAEVETGWFPSGVWIGNGSLTWQMGHWFARPNFALLSAKLPSRCSAPAPVGRYGFAPDTATVDALAVDGTRVFYSDGESLRVHELPAEPSYDPPPNDDFENAQVVAGDLPVSVTADVGHATVQPGEPLAEAGQTVWYAFRPTTSGPVYAWVDGACTYGPKVCWGAYRYGVYSGDRLDALTPMAASGPRTRIDAVAGETYWIAVGSPRPVPKYDPFVLHVSTSP